ncbi:MAG: PepSY domain-containing protein, partial [Planctomycetota bacterium]
MFRSFETSRSNGKRQEIPFLLILSLLISMAGAKDISLSEVPEAVGATIERETQGFEIDEVEQDKDDGRIVYEVDAENDDREIKLKVAEDGTLLEKEEELDTKDLPAAIQNAVKKMLGDVDFEDVEKEY